MRDIKFRAWIEKGQFMAIQGTPDLETLQSFIFHYGNNKLDQYTCLKDKNGVEIYEGDICKVFIKTGGISEKKEGFMYGVVKYLHNKFVIKAIKYEGGITSVFGEGKIYGFLDYNFNDLSKIEIIGNIHQNPELL